MEGGAQCLRDPQPPVQPSQGSPLAQPHPRSETVSSVLASEMLWTANVIHDEGFSRGKSDGSGPAHLSIPEQERRQGKFPGGPHLRPQHLGAHRRGRRLVPRVPAIRSVATPVRTGSCAPSRGRPRAGPWSPAVQPQRGGGGASSARCGWGGARLGSRLRSAAPASKKRRRQSHGDTSTRCPPGVLTLDQRPAGSRFVLSRESAWLSNSFGIGDQGSGLAGVADRASRDAGRQQVGLGCGSLCSLLGTFRTRLWVSHLEPTTSFKCLRI